MCGTLLNALEKIQKDYIHLVFPRAQLVDDTMESCNALGLAALTFPESMLIVTEDTIGLEMAHDASRILYVTDVMETGR